MKMNKKYNSEEEFLKAYNKNDFDLLSITTDILIFSVSHLESENYRKLGEKKCSVLLVKRNTYPYKDKWCLPGGFINIDEELEDATKRILKNETNLKNIYLEQLYTFSGINRDPRMRVLSTAYMTLINKDIIKEKLANNTSWFDITYTEKPKNSTESILSFTLDNGKTSLSFEVLKIWKEKTSNIFEYKMINNDNIAFDHPLVISTGLDRIKNKIEYTDIVFNIMPKYFTLGQLQQVYETILGKDLLAPDFRRTIKNKVEKTDKVLTGAGHRPSALYKYKG